MNDYVFLDYLDENVTVVECYSDNQYTMKACFGSKVEAEIFARQWLDFKKYQKLNLGADLRTLN